MADTNHSEAYDSHITALQTLADKHQDPSIKNKESEISSATDQLAISKETERLHSFLENRSSMADLLFPGFCDRVAVVTVQQRSDSNASDGTSNWKIKGLLKSAKYQIRLSGSPKDTKILKFTINDWVAECLHKIDAQSEDWTFIKVEHGEHTAILSRWNCYDAVGCIPFGYNYNGGGTRDIFKELLDDLSVANSHTASQSMAATEQLALDRDRKKTVLERLRLGHFLAVWIPDDLLGRRHSRNDQCGAASYVTIEQMILTDFKESYENPDKEDFQAVINMSSH